MSTHGDGFTSSTAALAAGRIHLHEIGTGEPLVFVHGFGVNSRLWTETARQLSESHRCILPELPFGSHPEAMKPDADLSPPGAARILADLLAALDLERVTVVANDSGGAISQILVTRHPERISRLVLTNCDAFEDFPPAAFKLLVKAMRVPVLPDLVANSLRLELAQRSPLAYGALSNERLPSELLDSWVRPQIEDKAVRRDAAKFGGGMDPRHTLEAAKRLAGLAIPVLLAWGEDDRFFKLSLAERLHDVIPDSRLVRIPDAVTFVSLDQPARLAAEIAAFVAAKPVSAAAA